jgi:putative membrane protein
MARVLRGMAAGLLAGLAASWVMNEFQELRPQSSGSQGDQGHDEGQAEPQERKEELAGSNADDDATVQTAQVIAQKVLHRDLTQEEKRIAGPAVHYAYGSVVGALYGGLAELLPVVSSGMGLPFGAALWLMGDEVAVPALGLAKPPTEYPPAAHADALAAHFMYGMTTDVLRRVLRHVL